MKKNGFTLVELLAVIIILSIVAVVAVPRLVTSIKINNEDTYNGVIENIILAANSYANNQGGVLVQISVPYLQEKGYLPRNITSPIDNSIMSGCVYVVDGTSIYSEETCSTYLKGVEPSRMVTNACIYQNGYTWDFEYTGIGQEFIVPCDGTYKLEVWGASGGDANTTYVGGKGGYSTGNKSLSSNDKIYINVGGVGGVCLTTDETCSVGGYNGGGNSKAYNSGGAAAGGGGGATHIGTFNDLLANHGSTDGLFIVAAGGGGGHFTNGVNCGKGGAGGGTTGADPTSLCRDTLANDARTAQGGTESAAGCAKSGGYCGAFGRGANLTVGGSGGGGGLYGGSGASIGPGGGGSSYIGGVSNGSTIAGNASMPTHDGEDTMTGNSGNGYARITLVEASAYANTHPYELGHTWTFDYTGDVQEFLVPDNGTYKLEVWGASGGNNYRSGAQGGKGGYTIGTTTFDQDETLYIAVGGQGLTRSDNPAVLAGGFNGGGSASNESWASYNYAGSQSGSGGGATHIAKVSGTIASIGYDSFVTQGNGLIVAGGGGGASGFSTNSSNNPSCAGGFGGGTTGGNGLYSRRDGSSNTVVLATGGTQEAGGRAGTGSERNGTAGVFGQGGNYGSAGSGGAGGGGLFGGGSGGRAYYETGSGAGGSSWVGNLTDTQIIAGNAAMPTHDGESTMTGNSGDGYAKITLISY